MSVIEPWEQEFFTKIRRQIHQPVVMGETAILSRIQTKVGGAYPGELVHPRRMDGQFALPMRDDKTFFLNMEINKGSSYSELKRSRMLDPHLLRRCARVWGENRFLNVLVVCADLQPEHQRYKEMAPYFEPDRTFNLWVLLCSAKHTDRDAFRVGMQIRTRARQLMGLQG